MNQRSIWGAVAGILLGVLGRDRVGADDGKPVSQPEPSRRPRLVVQVGHLEPIAAVAISPRGRGLLTGSADRTARLWEARSGRELRRFRGHQDTVWSVAFSPDGRTVLTGSKDRTVRLWDAATGKLLRIIRGHTGPVRSVTFSPDGRRLLTGSEDRTARLWDAASGEELRRFQGHDNAVHAAAFSPDNRRLLTSSWDGTARLWDAETGKELQRFRGHAKQVFSAALSPDGKRVLTGSYDNTARLWDVETGKEVQRLPHANSVIAVAFSSDGTRLRTGSVDKTLRLWDATSGKELRRLQGHDSDVYAVAFSADGRRALAGGMDRTARLWDLEKDKELCRLQGRARRVFAVAFSPDGRRLLTSSEDRTPRLWDVERGRELRLLRGHTGWVKAVAFSPDGKQLLTGGEDRTARLWDAATGAERHVLRGHTGAVESVAFSPDGKRLLTGSQDWTTRLWDAETGKELKRFEDRNGVVQSVAFSPDGRRVLTGCQDRTARLWDIETGKKLAEVSGHDGSVWAVAFRPDGERVLTGSENGTVRLWDLETGRVSRFRAHADSIVSLAFSPDGRHFLTGSWDSTARLWDARTDRELHVLRGHDQWVYSVAFSPDGRRLLTGSGDGTVILWDAASGRALCTLVGFKDGTWAVTDPEGRFDAANGGDVQNLHWVVGDEIISLNQLKERYYEPGLLAKSLGLNKERPSQVAAFTAPQLFPEVRLTPPKPGSTKLGVTLVNRGGGIGRVVVKVNGKERTADARPRGADKNARQLTLAIDLADDPRLLPGQENRIEVQAFNAEGYLRSRGLDIPYRVPGGTSAAPQVWAVVCGISEYRGGTINLHFAAKDADDFAAALRLAAERLFRSEHVHLTALTTSQSDAKHRPTRANLLGALKAVASQAKPEDVLVLYLAGHGVNYGGQNGDFYFLTCDAQSGDLSDPEVRKQVAVSSAELTEAIKAIPALKQVLVLDTCASGRAAARLSEKRTVPSSQVRALARVKDRTGMHVLAGCAADAVSYEATPYAQGLLTYSLLLGMRGAALKEGDQVDVLGLFTYACDRVPELARDIGGLQQPLLASPRGSSFPIGRLTPEDREKVPLQAVRPLVLRTSFQLDETDDPEDVLALGRRLDEQLRQASARRRPPLVFVDRPPGELPGACRVAGRYRIEKGKVLVRVSLLTGAGRTKVKKNFTVQGEEKKPDELADRLAAEVEKNLPPASR